jgi:hypothetical protein
MTRNASPVKRRCATPTRSTRIRRSAIGVNDQLHQAYVVELELNNKLRADAEKTQARRGFPAPQKRFCK